MTKKVVRPEPSYIDLSYLAGLMDGEAWIGIGRLAGSFVNFQGQIKIQMVEERQIKWVHEVFGGRLGKRTKFSNPNARHQYIVMWTGSDLRWILPRVLPFLRLKVQQAVYVMQLQELQEHRSWSRARTAEEVATQQQIYWAVRRLNKRGTQEVV